MRRRELTLVLRARVTWLQAALASLLVGHGFVLAIDLYSAGSRSVVAGTLTAREFDPLLGIVRPTLGGLFLSLGIFGPLIGARALAVEKDRRTMHSLLLEHGSAVRVVLEKWSVACAGALLPCVAALALMLLWRALGGHLSVVEAGLALLGYAIFACFAAAIGIAAAAFARSFAHAATLALVVFAGTIAIDAAEGFSELAWLGNAAVWSPTRYLRPFESGTLSLAALAWLLSMTLGTLALASVGLRPDLHGARRWAHLMATSFALVLLALTARQVPGAWDLTETRRHSLPPAAIRGLAALPKPLRITARFDREDSRRRQLETDTLAKLQLARPDLELRWPLDESRSESSFEQDDTYGRISIELGPRRTETRSTSRRELVTLIFSLADEPLPDWSRREYPGYPWVIAGGLRTLALVMAYCVFPISFLLIGIGLTTYRRRTS